VTLPAGYRLNGAASSSTCSGRKRALVIVVPVALALIFILLYFTYNSIFDAVRVSTGVPLAWIGGVLALWVRDMPLSISPASLYRPRRRVGAQQHGPGDIHPAAPQARIGPAEAIEQAALTRLRPVLVTAFVASLGFLPMALSHRHGRRSAAAAATVVASAESSAARS